MCSELLNYSRIKDLVISNTVKCFSRQLSKVNGRISHPGATRGEVTCSRHMMITVLLKFMNHNTKNVSPSDFKAAPLTTKLIFLTPFQSLVTQHPVLLKPELVF